MDIAFQIDSEQILHSISECVKNKCFISRLNRYERITTDC
jgi:hypothetical protein